MRTQVFCLETTASIALSNSVNPMTSPAASDPPRTPPSAEVAMVESKAERTADAESSFMKSVQALFRVGYKSYSTLGTIEHHSWTLIEGD
jgi:hypothetical protein